jgi:hypothetical protein
MDVILAVSILKSVGLFDWFKNKFGDSPSAEIAKKVVDTAVAVAGGDLNTVTGILKADPAKAALVAAEIEKQELEYFRLRNAHELSLRDKDTADMQIVNDTFTQELQNSANEAWYQKAWRPANGFCVALGSFVGVIGVTWLMFEAIGHGNTNALLAVPQLATAIAMILAVPGAAVGIAAWKRGSAQIEEIKNKAP